MKEEFIHKEFRASSLTIISRAEAIIEEYQRQGFVLTLRQLYYQFVARGLLENTVRNYKKLGNVISDARLAGLIDWEAIEDRTRKLEEEPHWGHPSDILYGAARHYKLSRWDDQPYYVEVWIEKEALVGVVERICKRLDVPYFACRGYVSQSEQYVAGKRFEENDGRDQKIVVFHLGDHDPSGIDMTRDNFDRLNMFSYHCTEVERIALNMNQVEQYNPPPNPAKTTDSRYASYIRKYGQESWELDALDPNVIEQLITDAVYPLIDWDLWKAVEKREQEEKALLKSTANHWGEVSKFLARLEELEDDDE